jgi:hypothetical protein
MVLEALSPYQRVVELRRELFEGERVYVEARWTLPVSKSSPVVKELPMALAEALVGAL